MKKWILSAAFFLMMSGYAAAQTTKTQVSKKTETKTAKKGVVQKKHTNTSQAKSENKKENVAVLPDKIKITLPAVDTTLKPVKN